MRTAFIPKRFNLESPPETGVYLTDAGELHYDLKTKSFYVSRDSTTDVNMAITYWYALEAVYEKDDLQKEYQRGYSDALRRQPMVNTY